MSASTHFLHSKHEVSKSKQKTHAMPPGASSEQGPEDTGVQAADRQVRPERKRVTCAPQRTESRSGLTACSQGPGGPACPGREADKLTRLEPTAQLIGSHGPRHQLGTSSNIKSPLTWMRELWSQISNVTKEWGLKCPLRPASDQGLGQRLGRG